MLGVLIAIIVVIGLLYLSIIIYQHLLLRRVRLVEEKNKRVQSHSLRKAINQVSKLTLSGQSLKQFIDCKKRYARIHGHSFDLIDRLIQDIENDSRGLNFVETRREYLRASREVNRVSIRIKDINHDLHQLIDLNKLHWKATVDLKRIYHNVHKNLLTKHYIYGPSVGKLQVDLNRIEKKYHKFVRLVKKGNHYNAQIILKGLDSETERLQSFVKVIPVLYRNLATVDPKQINEIKRGYRYMIQSGYAFPEEDMKGAIQYVEAKIKKTILLLKKINVHRVKNNCHQIENMINQLYDALEAEIKARRKVDEDSDVVTEYIEHAQEQNYILTNELKRLSKNYDLNHGEIETTKKLSRQLGKIDAIHQNDLDKIAGNKVVYSDILSHQNKAEYELGQIEAQQCQINRSVYDLNQEESEARHKIYEFNLALHNLHREVARLNLPGLPKEYLNSYRTVSKEIAQLSQKINQVKISMDDIDKRLGTIRNDMNDLKKQTRRLVDDAVLSERLMQYANRYRQSHQDIANANARAEVLFNRYQYQASLELVSNALDQIDPDISRKIKEDYEK